MRKSTSLPREKAEHNHPLNTPHASLGHRTKAPRKGCRCRSSVRLRSAGPHAGLSQLAGPWPPRILCEHLCLEPEPQPSWEAGRGLAAPSWTAQACCCPRRRVTCGGLGSSWRCALPESACRDFRYKRLTPAHAGRRYSRLRGTGSASWFQLTHGAAAVVTAGSRTLPPRAAHERWWHRLGPELLHSPVAEGRAASTWPQSLGEKGGAYPKTP